MTPTLLQNEYVLFFTILAGSIILAKVMHYLLKRHIHKITLRTKTDVDEIVLRIVTTPLYLLLLVGGLYFAVRSLSAIMLSI